MTTLSNQSYEGLCTGWHKQKRFVEEINPNLTPEYHALLHYSHGQNQTFAETKGFGQEQNQQQGTQVPLCPNSQIMDLQVHSHMQYVFNKGDTESQILQQKCSLSVVAAALCNNKQ